MSQQQLNKTDLDKYYNKAYNTLLKEADLYYLTEYYALEAKFNKAKLIYANIIEKILCTDNCSILDWVDDKIKGKLDRGIKITKFDKLDSSSQDIIINNYYNTEAKYEEVEW